MFVPTNRRRERGQALVETALVLPIFLLLLFGVIDIGRVIWANDVVANAAREGARYASVHAGTAGLVPSLPLTTYATKDQIKAHTQSFVIAGGANTVVTVCVSAVHVSTSQQGCSGDTDEPNAGYQRGNLVTVHVTSQVPLFTMSFFGLGSYSVSGTSTVLINN